MSKVKTATQNLKLRADRVSCRNFEFCILTFEFNTTERSI